MKKWMKLRDTITTPLLKGIFFNLSNSNEFDYINNDNKRKLNLDYYDIYSRDKIASQFFTENNEFEYVYVDADDLVYIDNNDYVLSITSYDDLYELLSGIIIERYKNKWDRIYDVLVEKEYEALDNYNMEEVRTPNLTFQKTLNVEDKRTLDLTDERTLDLTDEKTLNLTDEKTLDLNDTTNTKTKIDTTSVVDTNRFGFNDNSGSGSPYEKATTHNTASPLDNQVDTTLDRTGTDTDTHTGTDTDTHTGTDTLEQSGTDTMKHTGTDTDTHTGTEKLTRRGNIGVTTSQQMLESEIRLRALYNMVTIIYNDIDKVLTSPIYL